MPPDEYDALYYAFADMPRRDDFQKHLDQHAR